MTSEHDDLPLTSRPAPRPGGPGLSPVAIDRAGAHVRVLQVALPLRGADSPLVPVAERFAHFVVDRRTAEVLEKLATAALLREPCLLEGDTSTSKTSSIEYLASLTGNPLVRLGLSGQTDTSELIGKFVPNDAPLHDSFDALLAQHASLSEASRQVVERAWAEGRGLSRVEAQRIASAEGLQVPAWRWQDGVVPRAMAEGHWLVLDELNLAEPQVLERLNSVVDRDPSLLLSENAGQRIGAGGDVPLHDGFRVFATMNPASFAGRGALSPAFKDRFSAYKFVAPPGEQDYAQMLLALVFGEAPAFSISGVNYTGVGTPPLYPDLAAVPGVRGLLIKLANLHASIETLARHREIGREGRERLAFSRRTLLEVLAYLARMRLADPHGGATRGFGEAPRELVVKALGYFYRDRVASEADLARIDDQIDAIGLSERRWHHEFGPVAPRRPPATPTASERAPSAAPAPTPLAAPPPATPPTPARPQIVANITGGTILLTAQTAAGLWRVGQRLRPRAAIAARLPPAIRDASRLEVVGVSTDGRVVVRIDEGDCFKDAPDKLHDRFEPVDDAGEPSRR